VTITADRPLRERCCWGEVQHPGGLAEMYSELVWHRTNRTEPAHLLAELGVIQLTETWNDLPRFEVQIRDVYKRLEGPYAGQESVSWWRSTDFPTLRDAQLFAEWAVERWQAEGTFYAAGLSLRTDIDENGNPYPTNR